jgi:hypothetical protein
MFSHLAEEHKSYLRILYMCYLNGYTAFCYFFSFLILRRGTHWTRDELVTRPLPIHRTTQIQNKHKRRSMPRVGFETTNPVLERAKTVHASDSAVTVISNSLSLERIQKESNTILCDVYVYATTPKEGRSCYEIHRNISDATLRSVRIFAALTTRQGLSAKSWH